MIPRKKLQVLLYTLQIFYVFGNVANPGKEDSNVNELVPDNLVIEHNEDSTALTIKPPDEDSSIQALSIEKEVPSKTTPKIDSADYGSKENESNISQDHIHNDLASELNGKTSVENITVDNSQPNSLNVSWNILGESNEFLIELFQNNVLLQKYNTTNSYYNILKLEPCTTYTIKVIPTTSESSENNFESATASTAFLKPGKPSFLEVSHEEPSSLLAKWGTPKTAMNCVKHYRITIDAGVDHTFTDTTVDTNYTFNNLYACTVYGILVTPVDVENRDADFVRNKTSFKKVPNPPQYKNVTETTIESITLSWNVEDEKNNCSLKTVFMECEPKSTEGYGYELVYRNITAPINYKKPNKQIDVRVNLLSPFTHYECKAYFSNVAGKSSWSSVIKVRTDEDVPSHPKNFQCVGYENSALKFTWDPPEYMPGKLKSYRIAFSWTPNYISPDWCSSSGTKVIDNIEVDNMPFTWMEEEPFSHYNASISARTEAGWSHDDSIQFDSSIGLSTPDKVTNLTCSIEPREHNSNILQTVLKWGLPCHLRGVLHYFQISAIGTAFEKEDHVLDDANISVLNSTIDKNQMFNVTFGELRPLYKYNFTVSAMLIGSIDPGESEFVTVDYPAGIPPQPDMEYVNSITLDPHKARRTTSTAHILLPLFPDVNGKIKYYAVMVSGVPFGNATNSVRFDMKNENWPNVSSWEEAMEQDFKIPYQATEPRWDPGANYIIDYGDMKAVRFTLGDDTTCPIVSHNNKKRVYCNGPLKPDTWYEVRMRAFTEGGYADSISLTVKTNAELNVPLVLGVVLGILSIGILTTMMLMVRRCSIRLLLQRIAQSSIPESPVPNPFTRRKFINHCQQLAENPGKLSNEFQLLQTLSIDLQMPSNTACLQANRKKNRYSDILPYDFSRVKLEIIDNDPNSDYINASFVRGYSGQEEYIACQGPKEDTTYDFWRMIEQYDIKMIVMLTQLVERGKEKCHQYYPTISESMTYENITIKCTNELDYRTYTQRTLLLQKDENKRTITHLHFKDWPDHDVPDDFDAMIHFCQLFRKQFAANKGVAVIHCSAGIGRTGTLMAIDILLQSIRDNRKLDVFGTVYRLRRHRLNMVQRESQYAFIYNCIRLVLKNPYILKTYKPPPVDPIYPQTQKEERSDSSTDLADSFDTLRKNSLSTSIDSMQPLCQSNSPQVAPKIQMNGLRYCKSTSAIDTRSNHNRLGKYNSEGYAICESTKDSLSSTSKESGDDNDLKSSSSSLYENVMPLIRPNSEQTISESNDYLMNDLNSTEKDTSL